MASKLLAMASKLVVSCSRVTKFANPQELPQDILLGRVCTSTLATPLLDQVCTTCAHDNHLHLCVWQDLGQCILGKRMEDK